MSENPTPTSEAVAQVQAVEAPGFKVFAGSLAYSTTDEGLQALFEPVKEDVISAHVILRGTRSAGYGFVTMKTAESAEKAVSLLHDKEVDGRKVIIEVAKPAAQKDEEKKERKAKRRPGRRGSKAVPGELSEAEANGEAKPAVDSEAPGSDEASKPKKKKKARKPKKKTVDGETPATDAAVAAPPAEGAEATDANKKAPRVRKPKVVRTPRPAGEDPVGEPSETMLFVANLGFAVDDEQLSALFTEANIKVISARIVRRRWGQPRKSKGYGFVDVGSEEEQKKAIAALEGKEIGGRAIAIKIAVNTPHDEEKEGESGAEVPATTEAAAPAAAVVAV